MSKTEAEDAPVCRMCHCEGEQGRQLYFPCKCDGSIRYVHQDCLLQWLKVKSVNLTDSKCELCGEFYKFRKVYATGEKPPQLTTVELIQAVFPYLNAIFNICYGTVKFLTAWIFGLPIIVSIISDAFSSILRHQLLDFIRDIQLMADSVHWLLFWWRGVMSVLFGLTVSVGIFQFVNYLTEEYRKLRLEARNRRLDSLQQLIENISDTTVDIDNADSSHRDVNVIVENSTQMQVQNTTPTPQFAGCLDSDDYVDTVNSPLLEHLEALRVPEPLQHIDHAAVSDMPISSRDHFILDQPVSAMIIDQPSTPIIQHEPGLVWSPQNNTANSHQMHVINDNDNTGLANYQQSQLLLLPEANQGYLQQRNGHVVLQDTLIARHEEEPIAVNDEADVDINLILNRDREGGDDGAVERDNRGDRFMLRGTLTLNFSLQNWLMVVLYMFGFIVLTEVLPVLLGRVVIESLGGNYYLKGLIREVVRELTGQYTNISESMNESMNNTHNIDTSESLSNSGMPFFYESRLISLAQIDDVDNSMLALYVELFIGYTAFISFVTITVAYAFMRHVNNIEKVFLFIWTQFLHVIDFLGKCIKGTLLLYFEGVFTPQCIGALLGLITVKTFQTTLQDRIEMCTSLPVFCLFGSWVAGLGLIFHFGLVLSALRGLLRDDLMDGIIPGIRDFDNIIESWINMYDNKPFVEHLKRILVNLSLFLALFIVMCFIPLHFGHLLFAPVMGITHLRIRLSKSVSEAERSVELLVSHVLLPLVVERSQGEFVERLLRELLDKAGVTLELGSILNPRMFPFARPPPELRVVQLQLQQAAAQIDNPQNNLDDQHTDENIQNPELLVVENLQLNKINLPTSAWNVKAYSIEFRILCLILYITIALAVVYSFALHVPLTVGRFVVRQISAKTNHDAYSMCIGTTLFWILYHVIFHGFRDIRNNRAQWDLLRKWCMMGIKVVGLGCLSLTVLPLLVGVLNDAVILNPFVCRTLNETPSYPIFRCWAVGIIYLKAWTRFNLMGVFGDTKWKRRLQRLVDQGFTNLDPHFVCAELVFPVMLTCLDLLLVPFFASRTIAIYLSSYRAQTAVARYSYLVYFILIQSMHLTKLAFDQMGNLYSHLLDSRYLIGTELTNR